MKALDPKQPAFLAAYIDPNSKTWSNAKRSALKAGYSEEYSDNIMSLMPEWLSENIGNTKIVTKALKNLVEFLDGENENIKWDATKFSLKGLKSNDFSEKKQIDHTTGGEKIVFMPPEVTKRLDGATQETEGSNNEQ